MIKLCPPFSPFMRELAGAKLSKTDLRGVDVRDVDLSRTNLRGADLRETGVKWAYLWGAIYDRQTIWPAGFDPEQSGAELVE